MLLLTFIDLETWYLVESFSIELIFTGFFLIISGWLGLVIQLKERSLVFVFIYFELITLGLSIIAITFSILFFDPQGFFIALILLVLAGAETVVGLSFIILLSLLDKNKNLNLSFFNKTQG